MSARKVFSVVGTAVGGLIGWPGGPVPAADPRAVRALLADLGVHDDDLGLAVRRFQSRVGLPADGVAGPRTVYRLARYAADARDLRRFESATAA